MSIGAALETSMGELLYDPAILLLSIYWGEKNESINSKRHMHPNVHSSIVYNSQDMETN